MDIKFELLLSLKLFLALVLGGIIGLERERDQHNVGIRTFACICVASCLFVAIAAHLTEDKSAIARMLAAIATGLGFIGAGIIFRGANSMPKGLTTAAGLWATSAVGVATALNMFMLAIVSTIIIMLIFCINKFYWYRCFVERIFINRNNGK